MGEEQWTDDGIENAGAVYDQPDVDGRVLRLHRFMLFWAMTTRF